MIEYAIRVIEPDESEATVHVDEWDGDGSAHLFITRPGAGISVVMQRGDVIQLIKALGEIVRATQ